MNLPTIKDIEDIYKVCIDEVLRTIAAYDKETEFVIYRIEVKILLKEMQRIFGGDEDDPMVDFYEISQKEVAELEKITKQKLRLDQYDYHIGVYAPED